MLGNRMCEVTPAAPIALVDLAFLKGVHGIELSDTSRDAQLTSRAAEMADRFEQFTSRILGARNIVETIFDVYGEVQLVCSHYPIISVTSIKCAGVVLDPAAYKVSTRTGVIYRRDGFGWAEEVEISYRVGFEPIDMPATLKEACSAMSRAADVRASEIAKGAAGPVTEKSVEGVGTIRYADSPSGSKGGASVFDGSGLPRTLPPDVVAHLQPYVRHHV